MIADPTSKQWCQRAAKGDFEAASELLRESYRPVFAYFRRLTEDETEASDLTQITFVKVWRSLPQFRGASSVSSWIHRIAYCTYVDWLRQRRPATEHPESWWQSLPADAPSPDETAAIAESATEVYRAVDRLEEEQRQIIHLHYYQGLTLSQTAEVLEIPESTLKYRLQNALETLRRALKRSPVNNSNSL